MQVEILERRYSENFLGGKPINIYTIDSTGKFIEELIGAGYDMIQLSEGTLGYGDCILVAPDDQHYNFVIREVYVNCWTSGQTIRRYRKISKLLQTEIDKAKKEAAEKC